MDSGEHKNLTSAPDVLAVGTLDATIRCLQHIGSELAKVMVKAAREPIEKPVRHQFPGRPGVSRLVLPVGEVDEIVSDPLSAEAQAVSMGGETTPESSHRAELVETWCEYLFWLREAQQGVAAELGR